MLKHKFIYLRITNFQALKPTIKENPLYKFFLLFDFWEMIYVLQYDMYISDHSVNYFYEIEKLNA